MENESFFNAIQFRMRFNFTGVSGIPPIKARLKQFRRYFVDMAVEMMEEKLDVGLLPPNFELLLQSLVAEKTNSTKEGEADGSTTLDTAERFWAQVISGAVERLAAMKSALKNFNRSGKTRGRISMLQRELQARLTQMSNISDSCTNRLSKLLQISNYGLQLIRSTRRSFRFKEELGKLLNAATTLYRISLLPSFTNSLSKFAELAYNMGLSKTSTNASRNALLERVDRVIGLEFERLVWIFESNHAARSVNSRIGEVLKRFTAPCQRLGALVWDAVDSTCVLSSRQLLSHPTDFVPLVQRVAAVAFVLLLLLCFYSKCCLFYICITRCLAWRQRGR